MEWLEDYLWIQVYFHLFLGFNSFRDDSAVSFETKEEIWNNFASSWKLKNIDENIKDISLEELPEEIDKILKGKQVSKLRVVYD